VGARDILVRFLGNAKDLKSATKEAGDAVEQGGGRIEKALGRAGERFPIIGQAAQRFGLDASAAGGAAAGAATAAAGALVAFGVQSVKAYTSAAREAGLLSEAMNIGTENASRWLETVKPYGVELGDIQDIFGNLAQLVKENDGVFAELGVTIAKNKDGTTDLSETTMRLIEQLGKIPDGAQRAALSQKLFGEQGSRQMTALIAKSKDVRKEFDGLSDSLVFTEAEKDKAAEYDEVMRDVGQSVRELQMEVAQGLMPAVEDLAGAFQKLDSMTGFLGGTSNLIEATVRSLTQLNPAVWAANVANGLGQSLGIVADAGDKATASAVTWNDELDRNAQAAGESARLNAVLAEISGEVAVSEEEKAKRLADTAKAMADANKAADDYLTTTSSLYDARLEYQGLLDHFPDKINELKVAHEEVLVAEQKHGAGSEELRLAHVKQADAIRGVQGGFIDIAREAEAAAVQQANLEGRTLTAEEKITAQKKALHELALAHPEVKQAIDDYMARGLDPLLLKSDEARLQGMAAANATRDAWKDAAAQIDIATRRINTGGGVIRESFDGSTSGGGGFAMANDTADLGADGEFGGLSKGLVRPGYRFGRIAPRGGGRGRGGAAGRVFDPDAVVPVQVTVIVQGSVMTERDLVESIRNGLARTQALNGGAGLFTAR
jgi:hypothetical protein